ncbi:hypothetical protein [Bartonella rattimassiliensis]|uniref:hypothetical protein n=1 Tax=Bartonella rattimassiliensis TaxID=270250 RepID=UPI000AC293AC|nr:hypothetical protein [Bartonella rattimassiliensis]
MRRQLTLRNRSANSFTGQQPVSFPDLDLREAIGKEEILIFAFQAVFLFQPLLCFIDHLDF